MKTKANIVQLDTELDLFDISDWNFSKPFENNIEYRASIEDIELFDLGIETWTHSLVSRIPLFFYYCCFGVCLTFAIVLAIRLAKPSKEYTDLVNMENQLAHKEEIEYVDGIEVDTSDVIRASEVVTTYFRVLNIQKGYELLNNLCINDSSFYKLYESNIEQMRYSYDMYDCYARLLSYFGSYCVLHKIEKVVVKNDIYYCYIELTAPSKKDISSYVKLYSYNFTKHFTVTDFNEANLVRYMYSMEGVSKIPCSTQTICITMTKNKDGELLILEDDNITQLCVDAYTETLNDISTLMGVKIQK